MIDSKFHIIHSAEIKTLLEFIRNGNKFTEENLICKINMERVKVPQIPEARAEGKIIVFILPPTRKGLPFGICLKEWYRTLRIGYIPECLSHLNLSGGHFAISEKDWIKLKL